MEYGLGFLVVDIYIIYINHFIVSKKLSIYGTNFVSYKTFN